MDGEQIIFDDSQEPEGQGDRVSRSDMRMMRRAMREDYPLGKAKRQRIVDRMMSIMQNADKDRDCIAAAKVLVAADSLNAKREAIDVVESRPVAGSVNVNIDNRKLTILRVPDNGRGPAIEQQ